MTFQDRIKLTTSSSGDMHDLTARVSDIVARSGIEIGIVNVHVIGSTGAVGTIEFEPGLRRDLPEIMNRLMPPGRHYGHEQTWHDGNAHSHLQATTLGPSVSVPVSDGSPVLGTWQQLFLLECDVRPRDRTVVVTVLGDYEAISTAPPARNSLEPCARDGAGPRHALCPHGASCRTRHRPRRHRSQCWRQTSLTRRPSSARSAGETPSECRAWMAEAR